MKIRSDQLTTFAQETSTRRSQSLPDEIENDLKSKGFETSRDSATGDLWIQDRRGYASRLAFKDNRPGSFSTPSGLRTSFHFDPEGNLRSITDPAGRRADFTYDSAARITSIQSAGREWLVAYAPGGSLKSLRFPDGRSWHLESDSDGSVWRWTDRSGAVTTYEISDDGLVETMRDPLGKKTTFQANEPVSIQAIRYPDGAHELSALDVETGRRVVTRRDGSEYREFFTADGSSRTVNWPDCAPLTFSFDRSTGASSVTDGESQVAYFRSPEGAEYERGTPYSNRLWIDRLFTIHQGYHGDYSLMIWRMLNVVHRSYQVHRMRGLAEFELYHLLRALRFMQEEGTPIYPQDGVAAEVRMWTMAMIWWLSPD